jgi:hypothetical protein
LENCPNNSTEDDLDDRELPDESDMDPDGDEDGPDTEPCPTCKRLVYAEDQYCPHCGCDISQHARGGPSLWLALIVALCLILMLLCYVL